MTHFIIDDYLSGHRTRLSVISSEIQKWNWSLNCCGFNDLFWVIANWNWGCWSHFIEIFKWHSLPVTKFLDGLKMSQFRNNQDFELFGLWAISKSNANALRCQPALSMPFWTMAGHLTKRPAKNFWKSRSWMIISNSNFCWFKSLKINQFHISTRQSCIVITS